jgi:hypothetical protein
MAVVQAAALTQRLVREMRTGQLQIAACQDAVSSLAQGANAREAEAAMLAFLQWLAAGVASTGDEEDGRKRVAATEAVVVSILTGLCKQLLQMESTVSRKFHL